MSTRNMLVVWAVIWSGCTGEPAATSVAVEDLEAVVEVQPVVTQITAAVTSADGSPLAPETGVRAGETFRVSVRYHLDAPRRIANNPLTVSIVSRRTTGPVVEESRLAHPKVGEDGSLAAEAELQGLKRPGNYEVELIGDGFELARLPVRFVE